jgi:hypothetical protein
MTIWELRCAAVNDYAMIVSLSRDDMLERLFNTNGSPKHWMDRPLVGLADSARPKNKRPLADVSAMVAGALVLSERAKEALGSFFSKFGQLLELDYEGTGEIRYFYNVTNIVRCVDVGRSEKSEFGDVKMEVFDESVVPEQPAIFKDPSTADVRIYINGAGKELVDQLIGSAKLTGVECGQLAPLLW